MTEETHLKAVPTIQNQNTWIWDRIDTTDPKFTKRMESGARLTSINPEYQFRKMTELFGSVGRGWGYNVIKSEIIDCGPCWRHWNPDEPPVEDGRVQVHSAAVSLWYVLPEEQRSKPVQEWTYNHVVGIGHTPFRTQRTDKARTSDGRQIALYLGAHVDMEYEKKSITDAITKAMGFLGMSADVRMGMFDDASYVQSLRSTEEEIAAEEAVRQRHEFEDWFVEAIEKMKRAADIREVELIFKPGMNRVARLGTQNQVKAFEDAKTERVHALIAEARKAKEVSGE